MGSGLDLLYLHRFVLLYLSCPEYQTACRAEGAEPIRSDCDKRAPVADLRGVEHGSSWVLCRPIWWSIRAWRWGDYDANTDWRFRVSGHETCDVVLLK